MKWKRHPLIALEDPPDLESCSTGILAWLGGIRSGASLLATFGDEASLVPLSSVLAEIHGKAV